MTNRILSLATAAAIAVSAIGTTAPAMAAGPAPAQSVAQSADGLLTEVSGKRFKGGKRGYRHGGVRFGGKGFSLHLNFGNKGHHGGYRHCIKSKRVWTRSGWRVKRVNVCH